MTIELTPAERAYLGRAALDWVLEYFETAAVPPVYPAVGADQVARLVEEALPESPQPVDRVIEQFARLAAHGRKNGHPRMFGYVQSSGSFAGVVADLLASGLNQNVTSWRSAPSATAVEHQVIDWLKTMAGVDPAAGGLLLSGGSLANFAGLAVALRASTSADINAHGVAALPGRPRIYTSAMTHMSTPKAAAMLGIGRESVVEIPVDAAFRMRPDALKAAIEADRAAGLHSVCVVANAGEVNTGAIDPLDAIADVCAQTGVWLHVDGSYGGFAAGIPGVDGALAALGRADSLSLDPHKWLFAPLDAGCLLVRDPAHLGRAFAQGAAYVDVIADRDMSEFAFWDHGPELSRRFRALKIWFILKIHGTRAIRQAIEQNIGVARHLADILDRSPDFERLAPVPLSIVCFRYVPPHLRGGAAELRADLNELNRQIMLGVQREGEAYLSNALIGDRFALRACIVNFRTGAADV
ncbi:MAG: aminotransferase class V-fold PLP-dependent enzyme, partial [Acidobacteriota bacterium]|nr:aminotransferase class V-fold PLP-dependent enzyme [Acidobacteriota bacterium]